MNPIDVRAHLKRRPFQPFRVHVSDGATYVVRHPEMVLVTRAEIIIALSTGPDDLPESKVFVDPIHVTRIEPLNGESSAVQSPPASPPE